MKHICRCLSPFRLHRYSNFPSSVTYADLGHPPIIAFVVASSYPILSPNLSSLPLILILHPSLHPLCPLPPQDIRVSSPMGVCEGEGSL
jgi:hypothetical protein